MSPAPFPLIGEWASLLAATIWACSISIYARYGQHLGASTLNLYKNLVALACLAVAGTLAGWHWPQDPGLYMLFALSGLVGLALGDSLMFYGLRRLGAQKTSVIQCFAPPLAALLAWMIFGERLNLWEWAGLSLTTSALLFLIGDRKGEEVSSSPRERAQGVLAAMGAAACQAIAVLILRHSLQGVDVFTGTMLRIAPAILGLCLLNLWRGEWGQLSQVYQPLRNGLLVTGAAFMGTFIGLLLMSTGAKYAKAGVMTAISSTYPIWILPISYIVFRQKIPLRQILLTILAVLGVVLMMTEQFF